MGASGSQSADGAAQDLQPGAFIEGFPPAGAAGAQTAAAAATSSSSSVASSWGCCCSRSSRGPEHGDLTLVRPLAASLQEASCEGYSSVDNRALEDEPSDRIFGSGQHAAPECFDRAARCAAAARASLGQGAGFPGIMCAPIACTGGLAGAGEGEETYEDGSAYTGQLLDGKRHGHGVWESKSEKYIGQWRVDAMDGCGRQVWQDGRVYDGQFKAGRLHGDGRMEWRSREGSSSYEGQYLDDLKEGRGMYCSPAGQIYHGEWKQGMRHGRGAHTEADGKSRRGIWSQDKLARWVD
mmetsp:Transcript_104606/g.300724  ORF Transcript_104606/g.300724 Transcript_104606/m.300724 type:complete len:295 (-) Transcript_104606:76-960(-)